MQETLSELCGKKFRRQKKSDDRGSGPNHPSLPVRRVPYCLESNDFMLREYAWEVKSL
jgi:hypothetical protein